MSVRGQTRARARLCRWTYVQNRETRILQRVCENADEYKQGERERERLKGEERERKRKREKERTMCSKLASPLDRRTCEREGVRGPQRTTSIFIKHPSLTVVDDCLTKFHR